MTFQVQPEPRPSSQYHAPQYYPNVGTNPTVQAPSAATLPQQYTQMLPETPSVGSFTSAQTAQVQGDNQGHWSTSIQASLPSSLTTTQAQSNDTRASQISSMAKGAEVSQAENSSYLSFESELTDPAHDRTSTPLQTVNHQTIPSTLRSDSESMNGQGIYTPPADQENSLNMSHMNLSMENLSQALSDLWSRRISTASTSPASSTSSTETIRPYILRSSKSARNALGQDGPGFPIRSQQSDAPDGVLEFPEPSPLSLQYSTCPQFLRNLQRLTKFCVKTSLRFQAAS